MVPLVDVHDGRTLLYFSARDFDGRSHVGRAELSFPDGEPSFESAPLLSPGRLGAFDDSGVTASCLVRAGERLLLYYIGWRRGVTVPFYTGVGCAISDDGGRTFARVSEGPILAADGVDPFFTTSPWVRNENGLWRMWYSSCVRWEAASPTPHHVYHVRYAESDDGIVWRRDGRVAVDFVSPDEYAIARPCVVKDGDLYRMWYSHRGERYRIGYAESTDGLRWRRRDDLLGLDPSSEPWESEMVEYPFVFDHDGRRWLLYNGNGYGATGIAHAVLEDGS